MALEDRLAGIEPSDPAGGNDVNDAYAGHGNLRRDGGVALPPQPLAGGVLELLMKITLGHGGPSNTPAWATIVREDEGGHKGGRDRGIEGLRD